MRRAVRLGGPPGVAARRWQRDELQHAVVPATPIASSQLDQPFNSAVIELDDFQSDPPGHPVGGCSWIGAAVEAGLRRGSLRPGRRIPGGGVARW